MTKEIKILGGRTNDVQPTQIKSAIPAPTGALRIMDKNTKQAQPEAEVVAHEEVITQDDKVRRAQHKAGEPEVRVRHSPTAKLFDAIKRGDEI